MEFDSRLTSDSLGTGVANQLVSVAARTNLALVRKAEGS